MFPETTELAFRTFQQHRDPRALAIVFDRTAGDLLALGRHLAVPGTDAEDLVQATFVTAIEDARSHRHGERVLPWLVGILNNHARAARRRARRVLAADRLPVAIADTGAEVEATELQAELRTAIDRLPDAYRPVLRLVFEHGLQAHEIARTLERPAGTVRAQVTRGIELLRRHLPASLAGGAALTASARRGLAAVRQVVLSTCGGTSPGLLTTLSFGGLLMLHHKLTAALAALVLASLGFFWFTHEPGPAIGAVHEARGPVDPVTVQIADAPAAPERSAAAAPSPVVEPPSAATTTAPTTTTTTGELLVRLTDGTGAPVTGIGLAVFPLDDLQNLGRDLTHHASDAAGEARFGNLVAGQWVVDVDRIGTVVVAQLAPGESKVQDVRLPDGITVRGHVRDGMGNPVPGATIVLHGNRASTVVLATSNSLGGFTCSHVTANAELQARLPDREPSLAHAVRGADGTSVEMDFVLGGNAHRLRGRTLDAAGKPLANTIVAVLPAAATAPLNPAMGHGPQVRATWQRSDANGTFECNEVGTGLQLVFCSDPSQTHAPGWTEVDTTHGDAFAEVRLTRGASLTGTVRRDGAPIAGLQVLLWPLPEARIGYLQNLFGIRYAATAADGSFQLTGLLATPQSLRLIDGMSMLHEQTVDLRDGVTTTWNKDLAAGRELLIAVQSSIPLVNLRLVAIVTRTKLRDGEVPALVPIQDNGKGTHPAARSEPVDVVLTCMPGGRSILQLAALRNVPPTQHEVRFELQPQDVPVRSLRGRLVDAQAAPIAGATMVAQRASAESLVVRLETVTDRDGVFTLGPLPAGDYMLLEGQLYDAKPVGSAVLTIDRDEQLGDLQQAKR